MGFVKKAFGGRKPPETPQLPSQPAMADIEDVIDEISGVQSVLVTLPNGRKQRVIQKIKRTPQEEALLKQADEMIAQSIDNIQRLYHYDPTSVVNFQPFIQAFSNINQERVNDLAQIGNFGDIAAKVNDFKKINTSLAEREFDIKSRMNEEILTKRGLGDSSIANHSRAVMARERALLQQQAAVQAEQYGDDLMRRQLDREKGLYDIREAGRLGRLEEAQTGYALERQKLEDLDRNRQNLINENQVLLGLGQAARGDKENSNLGLNLTSASQNAFAQRNAIQNQRYLSDLTRLSKQHDMNLNAFAMKPEKFGQQLAQTASRYVGKRIGKLADSGVESSLSMLSGAMG